MPHSVRRLPARCLALFAAILMVFTLVVAAHTPSEASQTSFRDVPTRSTFVTDIYWLVQTGITSGCRQGGFCPDQPVTRAQMAAFLVRALDLRENSSPRFDDVSSSHTFAEDIGRLATSGITMGCGSNRFCPDRTVTRGQMAAFLRRALGPNDDVKLPEEPCEEHDHAISQHGVTWSFDGEYRCGRYANGDFWVVGPVAIVDIDPSSDSWHGSMINPSPRASSQGYGRINNTTYEPDLNVALTASTNDPLVVEPNSSVVSTIGVEDPGARPGIETAAVLTVVETAPSEGAFRPPYSGRDKMSYFTEDQLDYDLLPRLDRVAGTPDIGGMADNFERVWLDHITNWTGRKIHPVTSMPDYGRDLASRLGEGSLMLMLDFSDAQKRDLLVNYVQVGIDLYGIVQDGGSWAPDGGHAQGRKWPILFAGTMLGDDNMAGIGQADDVLFGEDGQTFYVTQADVDRGVGYSASDIGMAEWGIQHVTDPSRDDASWNAPYRQCCTANSWGGHVLSARIMGLQEAWNHDPLFDYTDRYLATETVPWHRFWDRPFTENMWATHRSQY